MIYKTTFPSTVETSLTPPNCIANLTSIVSLLGNYCGKSIFEIISLSII